MMPPIMGWMARSLWIAIAYVIPLMGSRSSPRCLIDVPRRPHSDRASVMAVAHSVRTKLSRR